MGPLPGVNQPAQRACQKLYLLGSERMSEDILHFSVYFHGTQREYLNIYILHFSVCFHGTQRDYLNGRGLWLSHAWDTGARWGFKCHPMPGTDSKG